MPLHRLTFSFWLISCHDTFHEVLSLRPVSLQHLCTHLSPALSQLIRQHPWNPADNKLLYDFLNSIMSSSNLVNNVPHCDSSVATNHFINAPFAIGCYSSPRP